MATLALMGAVQALVMAVILWVATGSYAGVARASLRLRAGAQAVEAVAWVLLGLRGRVGDWLSILVANAVMLLAYAMAVQALRMLLGAPSRLRVVAVASVAAWLGIAWFALVTPNFQARVLCASAVVLLDLALLIVPLCESLRRDGSAAKGCCWRRCSSPSPWCCGATPTCCFRPGRRRACSLPRRSMRSI
ncbi:MAG: hypothetical protein BGP10_10645 [Rhodanobacter sp. 68-29]|nr:MAG: hypothetical protein ABT17_00905 [Rhodanobacter sp. SCN 69-32]OJY62221.1 MAG: hypothetical protein BGP10_10645 [Rhodanobacter sp. 68-29]